MRGDTLATADITQAFCGGCLDVDECQSNANIFSQMGSHPFDMRPHTGRLGDHRAIEVRYPQVSLGKRIAYLAQQHTAVDILKTIVAVREVMADVTQTRGAQQGIANRMDQHITIRMGLEALLVGNTHPADNDMIAGAETVNIKSVANTHVSTIAMKRFYRAAIITSATKQQRAG